MCIPDWIVIHARMTFLDKATDFNGKKGVVRMMEVIHLAAFHQTGALA